MFALKGRRCPPTLGGCAHSFCLCREPRSPSLPLFVCLCLSVCLSPPLCPLCLCLPVCLSVSVSLCLSLSLSVQLSMSLSVCLCFSLSLSQHVKQQTEATCFSCVRRKALQAQKVAAWKPELHSRSTQQIKPTHATPLSLNISR